MLRLRDRPPAGLTGKLLARPTGVAAQPCVADSSGVRSWPWWGRVAAMKSKQASMPTVDTHARDRFSVAFPAS